MAKDALILALAVLCAWLALGKHHDQQMAVEDATGAPMMHRAQAVTNRRGQGSRSKLVAPCVRLEPAELPPWGDA